MAKFNKKVKGKKKKEREEFNPSAREPFPENENEENFEKDLSEFIKEFLKKQAMKTKQKVYKGKLLINYLVDL